AVSLPIPRQTDSTGDPEVMWSSSICCLALKPRFAFVPYSGTMRQATGYRSTFRDQWLQITSARRFPGWTGSPTGQVAPTIQPRTYCCRFRPLALAEVPSVQSYIKRYGQEELQ